MPGGDREELIDAFLEAIRILFPQKIVEIDTHRVHAERLRPAELAIDAFGNASAASNRVTLDVTGTGPGVPQDLTVTAPPQGGVLHLAWRAGEHMLAEMKKGSF